MFYEFIRQWAGKRMYIEIFFGGSNCHAKNICLVLLVMTIICHGGKICSLKFLI